MLLKKMIRILNNKNVIFMFYELKNIVNQQHLAYISVLSDEEKDIYNNCDESNKKKFVSNSSVIYLPYLSSDMFVEIYKQNDKASYNLTIDRIKKIIDIDSSSEEKIAFVAYIILHEVGHWIHFEEMGKRPYRFAREDSNIRKKVYLEQLNMKRKLIGKSKLNENEEKDIEKLFYKYHSIPMEKRADEYADKYLKDFMKLLKENL